MAPGSRPVPTMRARTAANATASSPRGVPSIPTTTLGWLVMTPLGSRRLDLRAGLDHALRDDRDRAWSQVNELVGQAAEQRAHATEATGPDDDLVGVAHLS